MALGEKVISSLKHKFHQNYTMKSRLPVLADLISLLRSHSYEFLTVQEMAEGILAGKPLPKRTAIIRCDVDSDVRTSVSMARTVVDAGGRGTWYWRLATLDKAAMDEVSSSNEIGYHFEELATVAKRKGIKRADQALAMLPEIRATFVRNLMERYLPAAGRLPKTVAAHGDFANRLLKQTSSIIVDDDIRDRFGIIAETYDEWLMKPVTRRFSDASAPRWWTPSSPLVPPPSGADVFYVLIHPRQFAARWVENTTIDMHRAFEGVLYSFRRRFA